MQLASFSRPSEGSLLSRTPSRLAEALKRAGSKADSGVACGGSLGPATSPQAAGRSCPLPHHHQEMGQARGAGREICFHLRSQKQIEDNRDHCPLQTRCIIQQSRHREECPLQSHPRAGRAMVFLPWQARLTAISSRFSSTCCTIASKSRVSFSSFRRLSSRVLSSCLILIYKRQQQGIKHCLCVCVGGSLAQQFPNFWGPPPPCFHIFLPPQCPLPYKQDHSE